MQAIPFLPATVVCSLLLMASSAQAQNREKIADAPEDYAGVEPVRESVGAYLYPDWQAEAFDWNIGPVIGARTRRTELAGVTYDTISSEIGLGARVRGIPVVPGNPGLTLEPYASYSWGNRSIKAKNDSINETETTGFQRSWYGVLGRVYYQAFRYSLDIGTGKIEHDKKPYVDLSANRFQNDFGVLILPFLSTHYTVTSLNVRENKDSKPSIDELDHWLHARFAFTVLSSSFDIGPGQTTTEYSGRATPTSPLQKVASVDTTYLKALASMNLFWKLGASGSAKSILSAKEVAGLDIGIDQLPNESLAQNKSLANLPKGSLEASLFIGLRQLFGGFGVGWQLYYLELANEKTAPQISRDQGLVLSYESNI